MASLSFLKSRKMLLADLAEAERAAKEARAQVAARYDEIAALTARLVEKEGEIEAQADLAFTCQRQAADAKVVAEAALAQVASLRASSSWRLTAPLRMVGRLFGR